MFNFLKRFSKPVEAAPVERIDVPVEVKPLDEPHIDPREEQIILLRAKVEMLLHENQVLAMMCRDLTRTPLTAQKIIDMMPAQHWLGDTHQQDYMDFARAIEAAHRIGGAK